VRPLFQITVYHTRGRYPDGARNVGQMKYGATGYPAAGEEWRRCVALRGRVRLAIVVLRVALLAALGLTPLGARFIHALAPAGSIWQAAVAWLVILVAFAATGLPAAWWLQRARRVNPEMIRPHGRPAQRLARAALLAGAPVAGVLLLAGLYSEFQDHFVQALVFFVAGLVTLRVLVQAYLRLNRRPPSDRLAAVLATLPGEPGPAGQPAVTIAEGWALPVATIAVVVRRRPLILVAPPVAAAFTDRQLRALLAHEIAHVRNGDPRRIRIRTAVIGGCAVMTAQALAYIPALRGLAGLHGPTTVESFPFLLFWGYLAFRVLYTVSLVSARAAERKADGEMIRLSEDSGACVEAMTALFTMMGAPETTPSLQRLMFGTHPPYGERLQSLRRAAGVPASLLAGNRPGGPQLCASPAAPVTSPSGPGRAGGLVRPGACPAGPGRPG
jgi:Zn-dependent protease with chaperone function